MKRKKWYGEQLVAQPWLDFVDMDTVVKLWLDKNQSILNEAVDRLVNPVGIIRGDNKDA